MTITNKIHGPANSSRPSAAVSLEQAKQITLGHAGIATDEVSFIRTLRDYYKDGSIVYKVEFWSGDAKYNYEINAQTGRS